MAYAIVELVKKLSVSISLSQSIQNTMLIRTEAQCTPFVANDGCNIIELLHPKHLADADATGLNFSLAIAEVEIGKETYHHVLEQDEVYYLLAGKGEVHIDGKSALVSIGDAVLIPSGSEQWIRNIGDVVLRFAAIVSPPWTAEGDRLV